jgi:carbon monoxide dehydrogenase subunit G
MEFDGTFTIEAESEFVWDRISDPEVLMECVPGAKEVNKVSDREYTGVIERGMAGITLELDGSAEILELHPPEKIVATASGQDSRTNSRMDADLTIEITPQGDASEIEYDIDMEFTGRLATLGSRIVKRKISSDIGTFLDNVKEKIEAESDAQA